MPTTCSRNTKSESEEALNIWSELRARMKPLVAWMKWSRDTERQETMRTKVLQDLIENLETKWSQEAK